MAGDLEQAEGAEDEHVTASQRPFRYSTALDGLRGIAVVFVVMAHGWMGPWPEAKKFMAIGGWVGVHMFFVLSGFLITALVVDERHRTGTVNLRSFVTRRARRIVPTVLAFVVFMLAVAAFGSRLRVGDVASSGLAVLTFTSNEVIVTGQIPVLGWFTDFQPVMVSEMLHTWSLAVEVQFYLLWGLLLWFGARRDWSLRTLGLIAGAIVVASSVGRAVAFAGGTHWLDLYGKTGSRFDALFLGALAAIALAAGAFDRVGRRTMVAAGTLGLAVIVVVAFTVGWEAPALYQGMYVPIAAAAAATIVAVVVEPQSLLARALSPRLLVFLSTISYSLYLWHPPVFSHLQRNMAHWSGPLMFGVGVAISMVLALVSYKLVEAPFRYRRRATQAVAVPVAVPGAGAVEPATSPTAGG